MSQDYTIKIDLNVLNHLGMGLYSNTPAVLTEIISNAWDADAKEVHINLDKENQEVTIIDDGHGMNEKDIESKFLNVGYARRTSNRATSDTLGRQVMGRKGIGKLAMFSLADIVEVTSKKKEFPTESFRVNVPELQKAITKKQEYKAEKITPPMDFAEGTRIKLCKLKKSIDKTENYLIKRLARRFSVIGERFDFKVFVNNKEIKTSDRDFLPDIEFIWEFGQSDKELLDSCKNLKEKKLISTKLHYQGKNYEVSGYIAGVKKPSDLSKDPEISNNTITIISNGRVFQEDILPEFGSAKVFTNYLVGEVCLDLLDDNAMKDMATSSRQQLQQDDPRYPTLKSYFDTILKEIDKDWDDWRRKQGVQEAEDSSPELSKWLNKLENRDRKIAENVIGKVNTMTFSGSKEKAEESKKTVLKNTVLAFEKLRIQSNLDALEDMKDVSSINFKDVFTSVNDIEASMFYEITSQRLKVIKKFEKITNDNELEKTVQDYLYDHLWLLDPSWERVTGETHIEQTLTKELKQINPDAESGARIDIAFKTISGKHVIIEMKRPKVHTDLMKLVAQGRKYVEATEQWYKNNPNSNLLNIEVIFLVGKVPKDFNPKNDYTRGQLMSISGKILTYSNLITQSQQAYQEYHDQSKEAAKIINLINSI